MAITVNQKSVLRSKTIWASVVTIILGLVASRTGINFVAGESTVILGFVFMVLRLVTNSQVNLTANGTNGTSTDTPVTPTPAPVEPITHTPEPMPEPSPEPTPMPEPTPEPTAALTLNESQADRIAAALERLADGAPQRVVTVNNYNSEKMTDVNKIVKGRRF